MSDDPTQRAEQIVNAVFQRLHDDGAAASRERESVRAGYDPLCVVLDRARDAFRAVGGATTPRDIERRRRGAAPRSAESDAFDGVHAAIRFVVEASSRALEVIRAHDLVSNAAYRAVGELTDPHERLAALLSCNNAQVRIAAQMALEPAQPTSKRKPRRAR